LTAVAFSYFDNVNIEREGEIDKERGKEREGEVRYVPFDVYFTINNLFFLLLLYLSLRGHSNNT